MMSPFEAAPATMPDVVQPTDEMLDDLVVEESKDSRPLTPPPTIGRETREDSPHRIPSFEFKFDSLDLGTDNVVKEKEENILLMSAPMPAARAKSITIEAKPRPVSSTMAKSSTAPASGDFASASTSAPSGSTTTRVRQRISREMIRETIQQRMADGTLSRHTSSASGHILDAEIPKRRPASLAVTSTSTGKDKDLPPPPPKTPVIGTGSIPMSKAHTTEAATRQPSQPDRPSMRPRSKTQSAEEVIASNVRDDGFIKEPKSALDRLMDGMNSVALSTSPDKVKAVFAKPISILQKPKNSTLIPPAPAHLSAPVSPGRVNGSTSPSSSTSSKDTETEKPANSEKKDKERKRDASGKPRRKSRRSMSVGDVEQDSQPKVQRHSAQPRLTLGFNDAESMLDAFKDETDRIGSEVSPRLVVIRVETDGSDDTRSRRRSWLRDMMVWDITGPAILMRVQVGHGDSSGGLPIWYVYNPCGGGDADIQNEHAAELRRLRSKEASTGKASGTVFVKGKLFLVDNYVEIVADE